MIAHLHIRNLGVIEEADLEFGSGMVVFTGETGAGKTMVVTALGLVLGDRVDSGLTAAVSSAGRRLEVDASVLVAMGGEQAGRVENAGGVVDPDGAVVVTRSVSPGGRSRASLGGAAVPVSVLAEFGQSVAQRHSQSDQILLRRPRKQRESLDDFGGEAVRGLRTAYGETYERFLHLSQRLADLVSDHEGRSQRIERLRLALDEIEAVRPVPGEERTLAESITRLANTELLRASVGEAVAALSPSEAGDSGDALSAVSVAEQALRRGGAQDKALNELAVRIAEAGALLTEAVADVRRYADGVGADPARLEQLQQRKAALAALQRKYGATADEILAWAGSAQEELHRLDPGDDVVAEVRGELTSTLQELARLAAALSAARTEAAARLSAAVTTELRALSMPDARFVVEAGQRADEAGLTLPDGRTCSFGPTGVDLVRFLLAPHAGSDPAPIGDGASGGELSRIMLALEVVLAESTPPATFVFDEVDAGIGGRTAVEVGRRLARLAERSQVLVVTHLAQVAAFADQHIVVTKDRTGAVTSSSVREVSVAERTEELARMLSGDPESDAALSHAEELLRR